MRWKVCAAAARPRPGSATAVEAPKWNPTASELQPVEESLAFISAQQAKGAKKRHALWAEQKSTVFSEMFGLHFGEGSLPGDGMEGLARGEDEERQFDAPLKVRFRAFGGGSVYCRTGKYSSICIRFLG
jgi:hypothetical protein